MKPLVQVFAIACGYPDGNDSARLERTTRSTSLLVGRDPVEGDALASQSTLSGFENSVGRGLTVQYI